MAAADKNKRVCSKGHVYYKSSSCPVCPVCEKENKPADDFLSILAAPARRALQQKGIITVEALAVFTETEIAALHGMGPGSIRKLRNILLSNQLTFKK